MENLQDKMSEIVLEEELINRKLIESIFLFYLFGIIFFGMGIMTYIWLLKPLFAVNETIIWLCFSLQLLFFAVARILRCKDRLIFLLCAFLLLFFLGVSLVPLLIFFNEEFGFFFAFKALGGSFLIFCSTALFGFLKERFMFLLHAITKYAILLLIFFTFVSPFLPWSNGHEQIFSIFGLIFLALITLHDFQKLRYYPIRAVFSAALHIFMNQALLFTFTLRLLSSLYRV